MKSSLFCLPFYVHCLVLCLSHRSVCWMSEGINIQVGQVYSHMKTMHPPKDHPTMVTVKRLDNFPGMFSPWLHSTLVLGLFWLSHFWLHKLTFVKCFCLLTLGTWTDTASLHTEWAPTMALSFAYFLDVTVFLKPKAHGWCVFKRTLEPRSSDLWYVTSFKL